MFSGITNLLSRTFFSSNEVSDESYYRQYYSACTKLTNMVLGYQDSEFHQAFKMANEHRLTYSNLLEFFRHGTIDQVYYINPCSEDLMKLHKIRNNVFDYMMMLQVFLLLSDVRYDDFRNELIETLQKSELTPLESSVLHSLEAVGYYNGSLTGNLDRHLDIGTDFLFIKHHYTPILDDYFGGEDEDDGGDNEDDDDTEEDGENKQTVMSTTTSSLSSVVENTSS